MIPSRKSRIQSVTQKHKYISFQFIHINIPFSTHNTMRLLFFQAHIPRPLAAIRKVQSCSPLCSSCRKSNRIVNRRRTSLPGIERSACNDSCSSDTAELLIAFLFSIVSKDVSSISKLNAYTHEPSAMRNII